MKNSGFSLIEVLVAVALLGGLLTLVSINLFGFFSRVKVGSVSADLISALAEAQNRAMNTDTQGQPSTGEYGVHFETDKYTIFRGTTVSATDSANFALTIPSGISLSSALRCINIASDCSSNIVFQKISGQVLNYDLDVAHPSSLCLTEASTNRKIKLLVNSMGVIDDSGQSC